MKKMITFWPMKINHPWKTSHTYTILISLAPQFVAGFYHGYNNIDNRCKMLKPSLTFEI